MVEQWTENPHVGISKLPGSTNMARPSNWPWIPPFQGGEYEFEPHAGHQSGYGLSPNTLISRIKKRIMGTP